MPLLYTGAPPLQLFPSGFTLTRDQLVVPFVHRVVATLDEAFEILVRRPFGVELPSTGDREDARKVLVGHRVAESFLGLSLGSILTPLAAFLASPAQRPQSGTVPCLVVALFTEQLRHMPRSWGMLGAYT